MLPDRNRQSDQMFLTNNMNTGSAILQVMLTWEINPLYV